MRTRRFWGIAFGAAAWLLSAWLLWRAELPPVPPEAVPPRDVYGPELLERSADYEQGLRAVWAAGVAVELLVLAAFVLVAPRLRLRGIPGGVALGVAALVAVWAARLPIVLTAHWWRRRYDISDAAYGTILLDPWLERLGSLAAVAAALALFMLLARRLGDRWWLVGGPAFAAVGAAFLLAQPLLLTPRLEPLRDERLTARIQQLAREQGVGEVEVDVKDASRRTRTFNAEFYGIGPTKRVVLWDTTLEELPRPELLVLVSHELGHVEASHVWKGVGWLFLFALPGTYVVARVARRRGGLAEPAAVPLALLTIAVVQLAILPAANAISRRYEREADWLALRTTRDTVAFEELSRDLARQSLADLDPPGWARILLETHPTPLERIGQARALREGALREGS